MCDTLEKSGLDFVQITLESHKPEVHDAMTNAEGQLERNRRRHPKRSTIARFTFQPTPRLANTTQPTS